VTVFEEPDPEMIEVPSEMVDTYSPHYCLQVSGNSMINDGIMDNDFIVVKQQTAANNGDIIVAIINDDGEEKANLKRYYLRGHTVELKPKNKELTSKFYHADKIQIRGKFCGLIRKN